MYFGKNILRPALYKLCSPVASATSFTYISTKLWAIHAFTKLFFSLKKKTYLSYIFAFKWTHLSPIGCAF